ncbi:hypothetical protein ACFL12_04345 [Pseudomonadota bacterium]
MQAIAGVSGIVLIVVALAAVLLLPFLAVKKNRDKPGIERMAFLGRFVAIVAAVIVMGVIGAFIPLIGILFVFVQLYLSYVFYGFVVQRLTHAGWNPWLVYVGIIPGIGLLFLLALFIVPGKDSELGNQAA